MAVSVGARRAITGMISVLGLTSSIPIIAIATTTATARSPKRFLTKRDKERRFFGGL
jgi:hypothetical protein